MQYPTTGLCVDASCSQNPGPVSFRGLDLSTGEIVFSCTLNAMATINIGEFLAICKAIVYLQSQNDKMTPIYSDSETAIIWATRKRAKPYSLGIEPEVRKLVYDWEDWLKRTNYSNKIIKWPTRELGDIPADYGRKKKADKRQKGLS